MYYLITKKPWGVQLETLEDVIRYIDDNRLDFSKITLVYGDIVKSLQTEEERLKQEVRKVFEEVGVPEVPETKLPEGVEAVKYTFITEQDVDIASTIFEAMGAGKAVFKSAVNIGNMVRTVMFSPPTEKYGTPIRVALLEKDMAWHMQQLIDWCLWNNAKVLAVRKEGKDLHVAFRMEAVKDKEPPKEKLWYHFKKTDGWTLVGEPK